MRSLVFTLVVVCFTGISTMAQRYWVATLPGNWSEQKNWSATSGGQGGATIPTNMQDVRFDALGTGNCLLDVDADIVVNGISMIGYPGVLNLNNHNLTTTGTNTFASGTITNGGANALILNTVSTTTFSGTTFSTTITGSTGRVFFNGSVFNNPVTITKTSMGTDLDESTGNNTFNAVVNITTTGHGITLGKGTRDQFNDVVTFNNNGMFRIELAASHSGNTTTFASDVFMNANKTGVTEAFRIAEGTNSSVSFGGNLFINCAGSSPSTFNFLNGLGSSASYAGDVTINVTNSNTSTQILIGIKGISSYAGNIEITNGAGGADVIFNSSTTASSTLASGKNITIGAGGFLSGELRLSRFNQVGATNQIIVLTGDGDALLTVGPSSQFGGNVIFMAPRLKLNGASYLGTAVLTKTGAGDDAGTGGNIFATTAELNNTGSGYLLTANSAADTFIGNLTVTTTGPGSIIKLAHNVGGTQFNGNVIVNSVDGGGVTFSSDVDGSSIFNTSSTISVGDAGFNAGVFQLYRLTLTAPQSFLLDPLGNAILTLGQGSVFSNSVTAIAPGLMLSGATYNGPATLTKTGSSNNNGLGGNTFDTDVTLINAGDGYLRTAHTMPDIFNFVNGSLTATTTGLGTIQLANTVPGTQFNGNIILNSSINGGGIYFSNSATGSSTLASGRTLTLGTFNSGELKICRFLQSDTTPVALNLSGDNSILRVGPSTVFGGNVDLRASRLYLNGISVAGTAYLEKNGAMTDNGTGGNSFSGATTIVNSGAGDLVLGNTSADIFNGNLSVSNTGTARIQLAKNSANNIFNGNVMVNSTSGSGIYFCNDANATANFNSGFIQVGTDGFSSGELRLRRITQTGNAPQTIVLSGTAILACGPQTTLNGNVDFSAPGVTLEATTFNGNNTTITKNGSGTNSSIGGNTFSSAITTITNSGAGIFRLANANGDTFSGNVTFSVSNGALEPAFNGMNFFSGNITLDNTVAITIGAGTGTLLFGGSNGQSVNRTGTAAVTFRRFTLNKVADHVTLNTPINVSLLGTFTNGNIITTATNLLNFLNDAITSGGSNASYVDGPVRKTGNDAFSFPTGNNGVFRPIAISAPSTASHHFTAQYFKENQTFGGAKVTGIQSISGCEHWILDRTGGNSNVAVTLSWNSADCTGEYINDLSDLRVVRWNGTAWADHGNGGTTGNVGAGSVTSDGTISSFSPFTIGSSSMDNPLPIELTAFSAQQLQHGILLQWTTASELNNDYFTLEKSKNGFDFEDLTTIKGAGNSATQKQYEFIDKKPFKYQTYYRLKQTDFDGQYLYSKIIVVYQVTEDELEVYPNPASSTRLVEINKMGSFIVINDLGVIVLRATNTDQLDISKLATGVYMLKSTTGETVRLMVN